MKKTISKKRNSGKTRITLLATKKLLSFVDSHRAMTGKNRSETLNWLILLGSEVVAGIRRHHPPLKWEAR
jgi:hypothetical protein